MNLVNGKIIGTKDCQDVVDTLPERIRNTLMNDSLNPQVVIGACDQLVRTMDQNKYLSVMAGIGIDQATGEEYLREARTVFSREYLEMRLKIEFGETYPNGRTYIPLGSNTEVTEYIQPLGVLLHIAVGNADGLPAFSVLEGLLTGNINILKLPELDGGISVNILMELINIEPCLAEYIYVFDYSSKDEKSISKLIQASDAVVVWGGDAAVTALRHMVGPTIKLIEWGHKVSFAFVTDKGITNEALRGLARSICRTDQLLCSSCQGIYLDSDDMEDVYGFCERFLPILEEVSAIMRPHDEIGIVS